MLTTFGDIRYDIYWADLNNQYSNRIIILEKNIFNANFHRINLQENKILNLEKIKSRFFLILSGSIFRMNKATIANNSYINKVFIFDDKYQMHEDLLDEYPFIPIGTNEINELIKAVKEAFQNYSKNKLFLKFISYILGYVN